MIIDSDTHICPLPELGIGITVEELIAQMDRAGVDMALSWPFYPYERERLGEYCRYMYKSMEKFPGRIAALGWIDPSLGMKNALDLTRTCMEEYGLYGVKLNGSQNRFRYDNLEITAQIVEIVARAGGIVALHVGADCPQNTHPYFGMRLAQVFPKTTFLFIHMGGVTYPDLSSCAIEAAEVAENILLVGSHIGAVSVLNAAKKLGSHRVCFGSDVPFNLMHVERAAYDALLSDFDESDRENILGGNVERVLRDMGRTRRSVG